MSKGNDLIDPDMSDQQMRLQFGEMTAQEIRTARAAIRFANSRAASTIASLSEALAEAEKKGAAWSDISTEPEVGRKVIALFDDGSGSMMLWRHDDGYVDQEGDEHSAFPPHLSLWRYLPDDFEFWCETTSEPLTLKLPPRDLSQGGQP